MQLSRTLYVYPYIIIIKTNHWRAVGISQDSHYFLKKADCLRYFSLIGVKTKHRKATCSVANMTTWGGGVRVKGRDRSTCLVLSCVSRLNGSNCYQHHHQLSFLSEGDRHMQSRHLAHSGSQKASSKTRRGGGTLKKKNESLPTGSVNKKKQLFFLLLSVRPSYHSVAHQHLCCLTDVIKRRLRGNET